MSHRGSRNSIQAFHVSYFLSDYNPTVETTLTDWNLFYQRFVSVRFRVFSDDTPRSIHVLCWYPRLQITRSANETNTSWPDVKSKCPALDQCVSDDRPLRMHVLLQLLLLLLFSCWCSLPASDTLLRLATICLNIWKPTDIKVRPLQALITQLCAHI